MCWTILTSGGRWSIGGRWTTGSHYTVFLLACKDGDGNVFVVDEHAERKWLPQRHAAAIKAMVARHRLREARVEVRDLARVVAGADVFSRQADGTTIEGSMGGWG
jgi:hypothetical protein